MKLNTISSSVLGTSDKRIDSILVNGKKWEYTKESVDFDLPGIKGKPDFFSVPFMLKYSDGSSRVVYLGFQYLKD